MNDWGCCEWSKLVRSKLG